MMLRVAGRKSSNAMLRRGNNDIHHLRSNQGNPSLVSLACLNESCRTTPDNRLLSTQSTDSLRHTRRPHSTPINPDFATNLIPSYPFSSLHGINTRITTKRIGIRHLTTDKNKNNIKDLGDNATASSTPKEVHSSNVGKVTTEESASTTNGPSSSQASPPNGRIKNLVGSVGKQVNERLNVGDQLSVYGIVGLIGIVLASPFIVRHMRNSDSTYDDDLDGEDPVAEVARMVRDEFGLGNDSPFFKSVGGGFDGIVADLLNSPRIQQAVTDLVTKVLSSPEFKRATQVLLRELWKDLVEDPETLAQVIHLLQNVIQDEQIKEAAIQLVMEVFNDKEVLDELVSLLQRLGREKEVLEATQSLLVESAHNALNDPEILDHSMEFATDVVGDDVVQQTAGEALYNTFSYAVRPTLSVALSVVGTGFIFLSISAFRAAYSADQSMDATLAMAMENAVNTVTKIVTFPHTVAVVLKNAIVSILLFPFRMVAAGLRQLGSAGNATLNAFNKAIDFLTALPFRFYQALVQNLQIGFQALVAGVNHTSERLVEAVSASFVGAFYRSLLESWSNGFVLLQDTIINLKTWHSGASSAVDELVRTALASLQDALSNSVASITTAQRSLDHHIINAYDHAYKIAAISLGKIWTNAANSGLVDRIMELEQMKKVTDTMTRNIYSGYVSANQALTAYSLWVEAMLGNLLKAIQSKKNLPPPGASATI